MSRSVHRSRTIVAAALVAAGLVLSTAAPASAHDELIASSPTSGERLDTAPEEVSLTFSADVLTTGAAVIVADADGTDWAIAEPAISAGVVTVAVDPEMPVAGYEIRWRVVSSDGHPISGIIPFTIGDADPLVRTASPDTGATSDTADASTQETQTTQENQGVLRIALVAGGGAAVAVLVLVIITLIRRRARAGGGGGAGDHPTPPNTEL